jgi:heme exporter protein A
VGETRGTTLASVIRARNLSKRYGEKRALAGVDLDLERGGFLLVTGPNGAGKTTLLRLCAGLLAPTGGELEIGVERAAIGLVAHEPLVYRELTPLENLELYGRLYRITERRERIGMLLERFGLWEARHERVDALSRGMTQRLALCRALLHEPELLLLDEPYAGLDTEGAALVDRELRALAGARTVALATHAPARVEPLATAGLVLARAA